MPRARKARTLVDDVHAVIRADILAGRLAPGQPLRMAVLRERFDVSLSVVREALTRLSEQRLVRSVSQLGFTVVPLSVADLADLTSVRIDIESLVLRRAVANGDDRWETALADAMRDLEAAAGASAAASSRAAAGTAGSAAAPPEDGYREAHSQFHDALAAGCPSPRLREIRARLFDAAELYRHWQVPEQRTTDGSGQVPPPATTSADLHAAICLAALRRDADTAVELLAARIQASADRLLHAAASLSAPALP